MSVTFSPKIDPQQTNRILDIRKSTNHPLSLLYSEIFDAVLIDAKLADGRSQPGFSLKGKSPFVLSAKSAVKYGLGKNDHVRKIEDILRNYYENVVPRNAAEWIGISFKDNHNFYNLPPWAAVFPWRARSIESYRKTYEKAAILENKSVGYPDNDIYDGWLFCGPVTNDKINIEAKRISLVLKSIKKKGYQRSNNKDGDAKATALVKEDGQWRWLITAGNHRVSAASALGYEQIPIRFNLVVNRNQVDYWPHVVEGLYTRDEALLYFDMIFEGSTPSITINWKNLI